jgi:lipopolysaccharide/colanic/teichoic acid biosynthesis glycosyltransferase
MDLALTLPGLVVASPVLAVTAAIVRARMGAPVLFRQERAGRDGGPFTLIKFRTMTVSLVGGLDAERDAERLTPIGSRLRGLSLDELPQLWNVIRGDMALVGPRPLPTVYVDRYSAEQRHRLDVRPGITGLAQVSGRNALTWDEKFALDLDYVAHRSVLLDARILWRTLLGLARRQGISAEGHATMPEFLGRTDAA